MTMAELSSCDRDFVVHKSLKHLPSAPLQKKFINPYPKQVTTSINLSFFTGKSGFKKSNYFKG